VGAVMHYSHIDKKASIQNAKEFLKEYEHFHRIEQRNEFALQSPMISDMPKGNSTGNSNEEKIVSHIDAAAYCTVIRNVIDGLENGIYRVILTDTYINSENFSNMEIREHIEKRQYRIEDAQFYRMKNEALLVFAEYCPRMPDINNPENADGVDLLVWKK
jgi:ArpU family phage transcriptional regulator